MSCKKIKGCSLTSDGFEVPVQSKENKLTTYCVAIAYDGAGFFGWAKQTGLRTVEGEINKILSSIFQLNIAISGSSRTDSGVHAYDQLFTFSLPLFFNPPNLMAILNQHFNQDIKIKHVRVVPNDYDLRKNVAFKEYRYYINTGIHDPFKVNYQLQYHKKISLRKLRKALALFIGSHYFYNFTRLTKNDSKSPYRTVTKVRVWKRKKQIVILVRGRGFLRYQIRYMIAAALDFCQDKVTLEDIKKYLNEKEKKKYPYPKVLASGLYLYKTFLN